MAAGRGGGGRLRGHGLGVLRSKDDPLDFTQIAVFRSKLDFERYWFSEQLAEARAEAAGLFQVPVLPMTFRVVDAGELQTVEELETS